MIAFCATNPRPNAAIRNINYSAPSMAFGHEQPRWLEVKGDEMTEILRVAPEEAATLQSYPESTVEQTEGDPRFQWRGAKTKVYLQIGNAVPPLLARHVLEALWAPAPAVAEVIPFPAPVEVVEVAA